MGNSKTILVSGATGRQGGAVVRHLLARQYNVRAMSRTPESVSAQQLISRGVHLVKGDMTDIQSLIKAMEGCTGVYSVQNFFEYGGEKEILYGKNMAEAAKKSNIAHFIFNSVSGANANTGVPHFETKNVIEQHIRAINLPATILRPVKFMENYYIPQIFKGILSGKLMDPIKPGKKHQMIAVDDIGKFAAEAFANPEKYIGMAIDVAGDELTNEQVASIMTEVLGYPVKFKLFPLFIAKFVMDKEMYIMFKWFNDKGFTVNLKETQAFFPNVKVTSLRDFMIAEGWQRWNKKGTV
jgi:uncharacterized protein YbjT (DUF2867 family)